MPRFFDRGLRAEARAARESAVPLQGRPLRGIESRFHWACSILWSRPAAPRGPAGPSGVPRSRSIRHIALGEASDQ
jgi:hypothetical protein